MRNMKELEFEELALVQGGTTAYEVGQKVGYACGWLVGCFTNAADKCLEML